jgi:hypothetical protein
MPRDATQDYVPASQPGPRDARRQHDRFEHTEDWVPMFDDPARDIWQRPAEVVRLLALSPSMTVVDLGAGTGRSEGLCRLRARQLVADYGFRERLVDIDQLQPPLTELDLGKGFGGSAELVEKFRANARRLIAKGADVLIPAEGVLNTLMVRNGLEEVDGVPVLDSYGAVLAMAEMLVHLKKRGRASGEPIRRLREAAGVDHRTHPLDDGARVAARMKPQRSWRVGWPARTGHAREAAAIVSLEQTELVVPGERVVEPMRERQDPLPHR